MKAIVVKPFKDKENGSIERNVGDVIEVSIARFNQIIQRGAYLIIPEDTVFVEAQSDVATVDEVTPEAVADTVEESVAEETPKRKTRTRKTSKS